LSQATIYGAGIIGLCCAYELKKAGFDVEVVDPLDELAPRTSSGNAGMIVPSHFEPLATRAALQLGMQFLGDPTAPFGVGEWSLKVLGWLAKFTKSAANMGFAHDAAPLLRDLNLRSRDLYRSLDNDLCGIGYRDAGLLMLCQTEEALKKEISFADIARGLGLRTEVWEDVSAREPALHGIGGVWFADDACLDPGMLLSKLRHHLLVHGVEFKVHADRKPDLTVLAAGAWTEPLAGIRMPLVGGRGFGVTLDPAPMDVTTGVIFVEDRIAMTQMPSGLRITGVLELGSADDPPSITRYRQMARAASKLIGQIRLPKVPDWVGARPCSPDGMPYIGRLNHRPNTIVATGHGMMGLSLGAITGQIVTDLAMGRSSDLDLGLLNPNRYA
jgi:D-amino-acid dehydrogenase